jgi:hypothetical protein
MREVLPKLDYPTESKSCTNEMLLYQTKRPKSFREARKQLLSDRKKV